MKTLTQFTSSMKSGIALVMLALMTGTVQAAPLYWDSNDTTAGAGATPTGTWGTSNFWNTDATGGNAGAFQIPTTANDDLYFVAGPGAASGNAAYVVTVSGSQVATSMTFQASGATTISGGTSITLGDKGITLGQFAYGAVAQGAVTISTPVILSAAQTWTNNAAATLTVSGGLNNGGNTLTIDNASVINFSGVVPFITGAGGIIKNGSGELSLSGTGTRPAHDYSGTTTINGGSILIQNGTNSTGTGNVTINNGVLNYYFGGNYTRALGAGPGAIQILGGVSGFSGQGATGTTFTPGTVTWGTAFFNPTEFVLQTVTVNADGKSTFSSAINLNGANRTIRSDQGTSNIAGAGTFSGIIFNGSGTAGLIKVGIGHHILSNAGNSYNGSTTITAGTLTANSSGALGNGGAANTLIFNGGTLRAGGAITSVVTRGVTMTSTGIIDNNTFAISIAGDIGGAGGLTKNGAGTLTLSGVNTYGGVTTVNVGTLAITKEASLASNTAANINLKSGTTLALNVDSAGTSGFTVANLNTLLSNISVANTVAQGLQAGSTLSLDTSNATAGTFTPSGAIANSTGAFGGVINLVKLGVGTLVIDQASTYTGTTTINAGAIQINDGGVLSATPVYLNGGTFNVNRTGTITQGTNIPAIIGGTGGLANVGSGTLVLNVPSYHTGNTVATAGNITLSHANAIQFSALDTTGAGTVTLSGITTPIFGGLANSGTTRNLASVIDSSYASVLNLTLNPQSGSSFTYGGVIADGVTGMTFTKTGSGTQILSGANTYTGTTTVRAGTLIADTASTATILSSSSGLAFDGAGTFQLKGLPGQTRSQILNGLTLKSGASTIDANNTGTSTTIDLRGSSGTMTISRSSGATVDFKATTGTFGTTAIINTAQTNDGTGILGAWVTVNNGADWAINNGSDVITAYTGYNTLSGATLASSGTVNYRVATNPTTPTGNITMAATGTIDVNTLQISDTAARTNDVRNSTTQGILRFGAVGGLLTSGGSHVIGVSGTPGTISAGGADNTAGELIVNNGAALTINSVIANNGSGAVSLTKSGPGILSLGNAGNSFTGDIVINSGTLGRAAFGDGAAIYGMGSNITFAGNGTLDAPNTTGGATLNKSLTVNPDISANLSFASAAFSANFTGPLLGSGTLNLMNSNGGATFSNSSNTFTGTLRLTAAASVTVNSLADSANPIQFLSNESFALNSTGTATPLLFNSRRIELAGTTLGATIKNNNARDANTITINTDLLVSGIGNKTLTLNGANTGANAFAGKIVDGPSSVISLTKADVGIWTLSGTNTYSGATTVSAGKLEVSSLANGGVNSNIGASGSGAGNLILNGGTLCYTGPTVSTDRLFSLQVSSSLCSSGSGSVNFSNTGAMGFNTGATAKTLTLTGINTNNNTIAAIISDLTLATSLTKTSIGTWVLAGANANTGATTVNGGGTLILDYGVNDNNKIAGVLTLGGGTLTLKGSTGSHVEAVTSTSLNAGGTFLTRDGANSAKLRIKAITRAVGGTISFADATIADTDNNNVNGILGGYATLGNDWATSATSGTAISVTALSAYTGTLPLTGGAATANYTLTGGQTQSGAVLANTVKIVGTSTDDTLALGTFNLTTTYTSATSLGGILYVGSGNNNYIITGTGKILTTSTTGELIVNVTTGTLTIYAPFVATGATAGILTKTGAGTLVAHVANSYTGATYVNQGVLRLANAAGAGVTNGTIFVQNGAALELSGGINIGAKPITSTGNGVANGGALRNVSGINTFGGAITVGTGGTRINSGAGLLIITNLITTSLNNDLYFGGAGDVTVSNVVSGAGRLIKDGTGKLALTAHNTYSRATLINEGKLVGVVGGSCSNSAVTVASAGTLEISGVDNPKQWTCASLALSNGSQLKFNFTGTPSTSTVPLNILGSTSFSGTPTIGVTPSITAPGVYPLLTVGGTAPTAVPTLSGVNGTLTWIGNTLWLTIVTAPTFFQFF